MCACVCACACICVCMCMSCFRSHWNNILIITPFRNPGHVKQGQRENAAQETPVQVIVLQQPTCLCQRGLQHIGRYEDHFYVNVNGGIHSNNDNSSIPAVLEEGAVGGSGLLSLSMVRLVCISYKHSLPGILLEC